MGLHVEGLRDGHHVHHHPQLRHHDARREARQRRQGHPLRTIGEENSLVSSKFCFIWPERSRQGHFLFYSLSLPSLLLPVGG